MISKRAKQIRPSPTLAVTAKAKEMRRKGIDVVSFGAGEPDFDTPEHIKKAAKKAIDGGFTKYTATSGIPQLKEAICDKFEKDNGLAYAPANILVSSGAKQCLFNILQVLINPGDEVLIPVPYWVSYEEMVKLAGGACVFVKTKESGLDSEALKTKITPKTKVLILNSPVNPTGVVYSREELEAIAKICVEKNIYVVSDEIYEKLIFGKKHVSVAGLSPEIKKLAIVVNGVSKTYAMTGWRIGYCAGEEKIIKAAAALQDHCTSNPNSIAQKAALAALNGPQESIRKMVIEYKKRRDYMVKRLSGIKGIKFQIPDGTFYLFADVSPFYRGEINNSVKFCQRLLEHSKVAAIPGSAFGDDKCIRLSFATSLKAIKKGLDKLEKFVDFISES